jgi:hypothetical protein
MRLSLSTVKSVDVRVYPCLQSTVWMWGCFPFHQQQSENEGVSVSTHAVWIWMVYFFSTASSVDVQGQSGTSELKCRCREQSCTSIRGSRPVPECWASALTWCQCPAMLIIIYLLDFKKKHAECIFWYTIYWRIFVVWKTQWFSLLLYCDTFWCFSLLSHIQYIYHEQEIDVVTKNSTICFLKIYNLYSFFPLSLSFCKQFSNVYECFVTSKVFKTQVKLHYWAGVALAYCKYPKTYLFALIALFLVKQD